MNHAGLLIRDAVNLHQALKADAHLTVGRAVHAADRRGPVIARTGSHHRRDNGFASRDLQLLALKSNGNPGYAGFIFMQPFQQFTS